MPIKSVYLAQIERNGFHERRVRNCDFGGATNPRILTPIFVGPKYVKASLRIKKSSK